MEIVQSNREQALREFFMRTAAKRKSLLCITNENLAVIYSMTGRHFNRVYCLANNIPIIPLGHTGGTIVLNNGDIGFGLIWDKRNDWLKGLRTFIAEKLGNRGINATVNKNDILINGKKVCGTATMTKGGMHISCLFFAVQNSLELVKNICFKKMVKEPTSLSEYGVISDEINRLVVDFTSQWQAEGKCTT